MISAEALPLRYALFAGVSTLANLGVQAAVLKLLGARSFALAVAMTVGTIAGFALKYLLDKRWIFYNRTQSLRRELRQVMLYGIFSLATTALFWATETAFALIWRTSAAAFAGATIGLCIGYLAKYALDARYTFRAAR